MTKLSFGNSQSMNSLLGASSHALEEREKNDWYATNPDATERLLGEVSFSKSVLEPACGGGHVSEVLKKHGHDVTSFDLFDHGYGEQGDFFKLEEWHGDIVTNPPYSASDFFVLHGLSLLMPGKKMAMFLKLGFIAGAKRKRIFDVHPPTEILVFGKRTWCARKGEFSGPKKLGVDYAWFIWEFEKPAITSLKVLY